jgi:hypothetical protein
VIACAQRLQAAVVANMTRDLRAALVAHSTPPVRSRPPRRPPVALPSARGLGALQSFDYVVKQAARASGESNTAGPLAGRKTGFLEEEREEEKVEEEEGCLPVSFLSSSELLTVVVPYLKCFLAMRNQRQHPQGSPSLLMHPGVQKHVTALMGALPVEEEESTGTGGGAKPSVLLGRRPIAGSLKKTLGFGQQRGESGGGSTTSLNSGEKVAQAATEWDFGEELEEFSD